ncbi:ROK family transcriptional regulator [Micromonospora sp. DR5-3]|uniref:ROK family transcriptional regulator n=1 Tax=unclassified Micromonospora TaxID=2617518 RepID=UPI0011D5ACC3|nr:MULTISPECIES: ROK family transcriptional regulator [unclassified Micromonospora]MCW3820238.1 ROK family transcriptional regulator [Micromonospora sp. DR5-3]TYC20843.1 ROK family transcriptional regulator [Micromonospora sp. MP36]
MSIGEVEMVAERVDAMQRVRLGHTQVLLDQLRRAGPLSRAELVQRTGLSRTTLFDIIGDLVDRGVLVERGPVADGQRRRGRPSAKISLNPGAGRIIGVDLGRARIGVAIANVSHDIVAEASRPVDVAAGATRRAAAAVTLIEDLAREHAIDLDAVEGIGLGLAGLVGDPGRPPGSKALLRTARDVAGHFRRRFDAPVLPDNNSRLAALAEATWGAARDAHGVIYVRWTEGVGGALILDGRLVRGAHGAAGELGHVSVEPDGPRCPCGGQGCLELQIGAKALVRHCTERGVTPHDTQDLVARALAGDPTVRAVVREAATLLGQVLSGLVVEFDPTTVVIGGALAELGILVLDPVRAEIDRLAIPRHPRSVQVMAAKFGDEGAALGGVAAVLQAGAAGPLPGLASLPAATIRAGGL